MNEQAERRTTSPGPNPPASLPPWQRSAIAKLSGRAMLAAIGGTCAVALVEWATHSWNAAVLCIPWMIALITMIPVAYRRGVQDARDHRDEPDDSTPQV